ncbi:phage terminase large subunit [Nonomuraea wenchangensis]|uniref:Phage terminase large subunit n=1 Tax=Nonomuraea wenchangensis TaxID=568860 RepID=A0A1H9YIY6_9ACTN|nr:phage terminase large subunit [Nonomuraea wenchangensis]SES68998.1 Phage terminase large subunit [Nonomuraea wenchangensis]
MGVALRHHYRPRGVAAALFDCRTPEVLLSGPAGTGKSRACLEKLHLMALLNPGMRALIVRKTAVSLGSTSLVTFREHVAKESLAAGDVVWYGGSAQEAASYRYTNGSVIVVGGMDKATKIMSSEYDIAYVQEAIELTEDDWEAITTRLRNGKVSFQQLIADTNPSVPTHWLWLRARCDRGDTVVLDCRHEDNPVLFDDDGQPTPVGTDYIGKLGRLVRARTSTPPCTWPIGSPSPEAGPEGGRWASVTPPPSSCGAGPRIRTAGCICTRATFAGLLPEGPRAARLREVAAHLEETWFCWIGGHRPGDVFYYRLQSPVLIAELDHHCGVFLDYDTPKPFHVHTVLRTPHGNDYGRAWVRQWQAGRGQ